MTVEHAGRKRTPSIVFGALSLAILMLITMALNQSQPPPPPTAEYAPEAVQAIKQAPKEQTSRSGIGDVGSGDGGPGTGRGPGGGSPPIDPGRVRKCIGDPPRQIEDPQSPPCVGYFDGDNGGATAPGVTAHEIRVGVPGAWATENAQVLDLLVRFFNSRFEFYNRKISIVQIPGCGGWRPHEMRGCAESAKRQNIFASLSYQDVGGNQQFYYDRLAELGIISVGSHPDRRTEDHLSRFAPYQWAYLPSFDKVGRHIGSYVCAQLGTAPAAHGGPSVATKPRSYAIVTNTYPDAPDPDIRALRNELRACGIEPQTASIEFVQEGTAYQQQDERTAQQAATAITKFNTSDVTTIICVCHTSTTKQVMSHANAQGYQPEWVISSYAYQDANAFFSQMPQSQAVHAFGVTFWNKVVEPQHETWYWAIDYARPRYDYEGNPFVYFAGRFLYHQLLVLASGIQMAGPRLTPHTFQDGMWKTTFPNPHSPYFVGTVGFEDQDHTFVNDAAIIWWDPSGRDPWVSTPGAFCYVRRGERNPIGGYPQRDEAFTPRVCRR